MQRRRVAGALACNEDSFYSSSSSKASLPRLLLSSSSYLHSALYLMKELPPLPYYQKEFWINLHYCDPRVAMNF